MKRTRFDTLSDILFLDRKGSIHLKNSWKNILDNDPHFTNVFLTVDLVFGDGNLIRVSTDPIEVYSGTDKIGYLPLLIDEPTIGSSYTIGSGDASQRSISLTLDGRLIDALSIINKGRTIAGVGQICLQVNGFDYANRLVLLDGIMSGGIDFGFKDEPISLTINDPVVSKDRIAPQYYITKEDFPNMPDDQIGQKFPIIVNGFSGGVPLIRILKTSSYEYGCTFVVCFGHLANVNAISIEGVDIQKQDVERGWSVQRKTTQSGIPYTAVDFVFPASVTIEGDLGPNTSDSSARYGLWPDSVSVYAKVDVNDSEKKNILEIIIHLILENTNFTHDDIDWNLYGKSLSKMINVDTQVLINGSDSDNSGTILDYIQSTLLKSLPMVNICFNGVGIGILYTDRRISTYIIDMVKGQNLLIDRVSSIKETNISEVYNSFNLKFDFDAEKNNYKQSIVIDASNNRYCKLSEEIFGKREYEIIESVTIFEEQSANYVLNWLAAHNSLPRYEVQYNVIASAISYLDVGDNVSITDDELGWQSVSATITALDYNQGNLIATFTVWILFDDIGSQS